MRAYVLAAWTVIAATALAQSPESGSKGDDAPAPETKKADPKRDALFKTMLSRVDQTRILSTKGPRGPNNYFVVGVMSLDVASKALDVKFDVHQGVRKSANEITDHLAAAEPNRVLKDYRIYARYPTSAEADAAVNAIRKQYDDLQAYRQKMLEAYNASTIRRC